jgi:hypothetical protein
MGWEPHGLFMAIRECISNRNLRLSLKDKGLARAELFSWQKPAESIWYTLNEI